jgi:signal transduction histidine kinase
MLKKLETGGKALANGNLAYKTDTKGMILDLKNHGENLNSIATGMTKALEARLKSERMKTELITNVSHDIKTPLTSIINYASLIGNELKDKDDEKLSEYSEVLVRQSESLKRLIEDLVEASKASSGNLDVALAPCDASIFISQASGEYEEKLKKTDLTLVTKESPEELYIMADGRRMWRIFDNLMNNICKYALPGTRVYLSLERFSDRALITFKNTSKEPLDMTEEELMERFTRGDSSRHTEGNGLGLSIARSLAELQNGQLRLALDGDLFKAILSFPLVEKPAEPENGNE